MTIKNVIIIFLCVSCLLFSKLSYTYLHMWMIRIYACLKNIIHWLCIVIVIIGVCRTYSGHPPSLSVVVQVVVVVVAKKNLLYHTSFFFFTGHTYICVYVTPHVKCKFYFIYTHLHWNWIRIKKDERKWYKKKLLNKY